MFFTNSSLLSLIAGEEHPAKAKVCAVSISNSLSNATFL